MACGAVAYVPRLLPVAPWRVGDISTVNMHPFCVAIIGIFCSVSTVKAHESGVEADQRLIDEVLAQGSYAVLCCALCTPVLSTPSVPLPRGTGLAYRKPLYQCCSARRTF